MLKTIPLMLTLLLVAPSAHAAKALVLADVGQVWSDQQQQTDVGFRTAYHGTLGPLFFGPEVGFHRLSGSGGNTDLLFAGVRGGLDVLTAVSAFVRVEGLTSEDSGMTYGLSYDFNKIPGLTAGVHAAMMDLNGAWMPTAGLHGGLRV